MPPLLERTTFRQGSHLAFPYPALEDHRDIRLPKVLEASVRDWALSPLDNVILDIHDIA
jgi:hypothetical protein